MRKLAVVIVNYGSYSDCCGCVNSLIEHGGVAAEDIVIVDNASPDGSGLQLKKDLSNVNVILSPVNGGFGAGINRGIDSLEAEYYLVLNPDTRVRDDRLQSVVGFFEKDPRLGILGLKLINGDDTPQYSARRFYSILSILIRRTPLKRLPAFRKHDEQHLMKDAWHQGLDLFEADWVIGTGFVVRRAAFIDVGRMDEGYFLYLEDTDLCKRMWISGRVVKATSRVEILHFHQRNSAKKLFSKASARHLASSYRFHKKFGLPLFGHGARN